MLLRVKRLAHERRRGRDVLAPLAVALAAIFTFSGLMLTGGAGKPGEAMVLVFPPGWNDQRVVAAVLARDLTLMDLGTRPSLALVMPDDATALQRARDTGAWLVLNAAAARVCGFSV